MVNKVIDGQQLKAICDVFGETSRGFTKTELTRLLQQTGIEVMSDGSKSNGFTYQYGLNKRDWLYNCLANEVNKNHSLTRVYAFVEKALNPVAFTSEEIQIVEKQHVVQEQINRIL